MTIVEQITRLRTGRTGLTAHDPARACPGYLLYAPMFESGEVFLLDMEGQEVHRWTTGYRPGLWGYLLPNGNLFYGGKVSADPSLDRFPSWKRFRGGVMLELDWDGRVVWEHRDPDHHHDARRTDGGGAIYLTVERVPDDLVGRVQGGTPGSGAEGMWADVIVEVDAQGRRIWEWHASEQLDPATDILTYNDRRDEWSHGNTVVPLPDDRVLVSFRNISTIGIINKASGEFEWKLGSERLAQQHDPSLLENGNILVYDNGAYRSKFPLTYSRVLEIDLASKRIVWRYQDNPPIAFFSPYISGVSRLPNGNTLITEGEFGRMFQVTPEGEVVWEYIHPDFSVDPDGQNSNGVFRARHYPPEAIPALA